MRLRDRDSIKYMQQQLNTARSLRRNSTTQHFPGHPAGSFTIFPYASVAALSFSLLLFSSLLFRGSFFFCAVRNWGGRSVDSQRRL